MARSVEIASDWADPLCGFPSTLFPIAQHHKATELIKLSSYRFIIIRSGVEGQHQVSVLTGKSPKGAEAITQ